MLDKYVNLSFVNTYIVLSMINFCLYPALAQKIKTIIFFTVFDFNLSFCGALKYP